MGDYEFVITYFYVKIIFIEIYRLVAKFKLFYVTRYIAAWQIFLLDN